MRTHFYRELVTNSFIAYISKTHFIISRFHELFSTNLIFKSFYYCARARFDDESNVCMCALGEMLQAKG